MPLLGSTFYLTVFYKSSTKNFGSQTNTFLSLICTVQEKKRFTLCLLLLSAGLGFVYPFEPPIHTAGWTCECARLILTWVHLEPSAATQLANQSAARHRPGVFLARCLMVWFALFTPENLFAIIWLDAGVPVGVGGGGCSVCLSCIPGIPHPHHPYLHPHCSFPPKNRNCCLCEWCYGYLQRRPPPPLFQPPSVAPSQHSHFCIWPSIWFFVLPVSIADLNIGQAPNCWKGLLFFPLCELTLYSFARCSLKPPSEEPLGSQSGSACSENLKCVITRLLPPITGNQRGIYGGGANSFFPLVGTVDVSAQDWNIPILYRNTYFIIFSHRPSSGCTWSTRNLNFRFFFPPQRPTGPSLCVRPLGSVPKGYLITRHNAACLTASLWVHMSETSSPFVCIS